MTAHTMRNESSTREGRDASDANVANDGTKASPDSLDLVFVVDTTASMGSYIKAAQTNIRKIMESIVAAEKINARFALVAYRDHPPQDVSFVTRSFEFTSSRKEMQKNVDWMSARGGGDGPEAVAAGLRAALDMDWRKEAAKVVILIADAPPHGLGERGDGFPNGCPDGNDPLELAHTMLNRGICVYPVGCEPALGSYRFARSFMCSLANITQGQAVTLGSAELLADVIVGGAAEEVALEKLMSEVSAEIEEEQAAAYATGAGELDDHELCARVQSKMASRGTRVRSMVHNAKMSAPHAEAMSKKVSLAAWREEAPKDDSASSFRTKKKKRRGGGGGGGSLKSRSMSPPSAESAAATEVRLEETSISLEQVLRCHTKAKARRG